MYKHILVPVDGSEPSNGALRTAISLSKEMGARIRLLHVVDRAVYLAGYDPSGGVSADMFATLRDSGYRILRDAATAAISEGLELFLVITARVKDTFRLGRENLLFPRIFV